MKLGEFQHLIEEWLPPATAWKGDNVGLQIGRNEAVVRNILVTLDVTLEVGIEAVRKDANLIVTHHPLFFHPLRSLTSKSRNGEIALYLAERKINLYAAHTNLDHARGGVSFAMAAALGLRNVRSLSQLDGHLVKMTVNVPSSHLEAVANAMHQAGGGRFSNYEEVSFRSEGIGTFKGTESSRPFIGSPGVLEKTPEVKLEMLVERWNVSKVLKAMVSRHPYEEIAYDLLPLENKSSEHGLGAIGECQKPMTQEKFLAVVKRTLKVPSLRYTGMNGKSVHKVAVCGGAGFDAAEEAMRQGADAFVTADIKYHGFQEVQRDLFLIDAGHYETEHRILPLLASKIREIAKTRHTSSKVFITQKNTNPVSYY